jgi:hypothetical protein
VFPAIGAPRNACKKCNRSYGRPSDLKGHQLKTPCGRQLGLVDEDGEWIADKLKKMPKKRPSARGDSSTDEDEDKLKKKPKQKPKKRPSARGDGPDHIPKKKPATQQDAPIIYPADREHDAAEDLVDAADSARTNDPAHAAAEALVDADDEVLAQVRPPRTSKNRSQKPSGPSTSTGGLTGTKPGPVKTGAAVSVSARVRAVEERISSEDERTRGESAWTRKSGKGKATSKHAATPTVPAATPTVPAATPTVPAANPTVPAATPTVPADDAAADVEADPAAGPAAAKNSPHYGMSFDHTSYCDPPTPRLNPTDSAMEEDDRLELESRQESRRYYKLSTNAGFTTSPANPWADATKEASLPDCRTEFDRMSEASEFLYDSDLGATEETTPVDPVDSQDDMISSQGDDPGPIEEDSQEPRKSKRSRRQTKPYEPKVYTPAPLSAEDKARRLAFMQKKMKPAKSTSSYAPSSTAPSTAKKMKPAKSTSSYAPSSTAPSEDYASAESIDSGLPHWYFSKASTTASSGSGRSASGKKLKKPPAKKPATTKKLVYDAESTDSSDSERRRKKVAKKNAKKQEKAERKAEKEEKERNPSKYPSYLLSKDVGTSRANERITVRFDFLSP